MDPEMQKKIDAILQRVREPETLEPIGNLNLVRKITYSPGWNKFVISMDIRLPRGNCFVCNVVTGTIQGSIERELAGEFKREFPGAEIQFE